MFRFGDLVQVKGMFFTEVFMYVCEYTGPRSLGDRSGPASWTVVIENSIDYEPGALIWWPNSMLAFYD